ncbi:hypothetical protein NHH73_05635 [Oxalobacteraceae bacterium OTU3CINTB1]|nr:hypothetical protein NHH73_05635 [Oxalobacteraceae bacterium OTU3CINTB1]
MGNGSTATSRLGEGDLNPPSGAPSRLWSAIFMADPMTRVPDSNGVTDGSIH